MRIQRPLPRIAEIGGTDLRQGIYLQIPHLAKRILAPACTQFYRVSCLPRPVLDGQSRVPPRPGPDGTGQV
jgi:hypothetical protein